MYKKTTILNKGLLSKLVNRNGNYFYHHHRLWKCIPTLAIRDLSFPSEINIACDLLKSNSNVPKRALLLKGGNASVDEAQYIFHSY